MRGHGHGAASSTTRAAGTGNAADDDGAARPLLSSDRLAVVTPKLERVLREELEPNDRRLRVALVVFAVADVAAPVLAARAAWRRGEGAYDVTRAEVDSCVLAVVGAVACVVAAVAPFTTATAAYYVAVFRLILLAGKGVAFDWFGYNDAHDDSHEDHAQRHLATASVLVILGFASTIVELALLSRVGASASTLALAREWAATDGAKGALPPHLQDEEGDFKPPAKELSYARLAQFMSPYFWPRGARNKLRCLITWTFLIGSKTANLLAPLFIGRAVQRLSEGRPASDVYPLVGAYAALLFTSKACTELQNVAYLGVKQNAFAQIAEKSFAHLHTLSLEWHLKKKLGPTLRSLDRGISAADTVVSYLFMYLVPSFVELLVTMAIFYEHFNVPALSAAVFISFMTYSVLTVNMALWRKRFRESTNKHDNAFHDRATDSLINFETVKYFTAEEFETRRYTDAVRNYQAYSVLVQLSLSLLNGTQQLVIQSCQFTSLCISAYQVAKGAMEIGAFVSVQTYVLQVFAPLNFLGTIWNALVQARVDVTNFSQLMAEEPDVSDAPHAKDLQLDKNVGWQVRFESVVFRYPTQSTLAGLKGVSFEIAAGTETAVCGKTGAGKSTLSRLLFRFYDPQAGVVRVSGQDIRLVTQKSLREHVGVVPQDMSLFNESLLFNVRYGRPDATMEEIEDACARAQILDTIRALPEGWNTVVGERGLKLSGGEKQRVAIARAFLKNAPILVLDEWSSALDLATERQVHATISALAVSRTTLTIAHRLATIARAHQIIVLDGGEIVERGTHDELMARQPPSRYAQMWATQVQESALPAAAVAVNSVKSS